MHAETAIFRGAEKPGGFLGHIEDGNVICVIEAGEGYTKEEGYQAIRLLQDIFSRFAAENPAQVDSQIKELIREGNLPVRVSLAYGILGSGTIHLKTFGNGQIWLKRESDFVTLIKDNHGAAGPVYGNDIFMFTTGTFISTLASTASLSSFVMNSSLSAGIEELNVFINDQKKAEGIALFTKLSKSTHQKAAPEAAIPLVQNEVQQDPAPAIQLKKRFAFPTFPDIGYLLQTNKKKKLITLGFVFVIILILIWSVGFGYQRRQTALALEKINNTKEMVTQKLNQSDEVAFLNPQRSMVLISEANNEVSLLRKEVGEAYQKEVDEIAAMVKQREDQITHKENKTAEEFFDLTIDNENAEGNQITLSGYLLAVSDIKNGLIYTISIEKKSLDTYKVPEVKSSNHIVNYESLFFFYSPGKGLYKVDDAGKSGLAIETDKEMGSVADIAVYNGNLYFLSPSQNNIYKYVPVENGYSEKTSYIKSGLSGAISQNATLAIDSSVYVATDDQILKFTAGAADEFKTVFPDGNVQIDKIITNADLEKVYGWDKNAGVMYILGKNGTYERQVRSGAFAKASDVVVYNSAAYTLENKKIFKINLD